MCRGSDGERARRSLDFDLISKICNDQVLLHLTGGGSLDWGEKVARS
jgi:hypothetical protein